MCALEKCRSIVFVSPLNRLYLSLSLSCQLCCTADERFFYPISSTLNTALLCDNVSRAVVCEIHTLAIVIGFSHRGPYTSVIASFWRLLVAVCECNGSIELVSSFPTAVLPDYSRSCARIYLPHTYTRHVQCSARTGRLCGKRRKRTGKKSPFCW